MPKKKNTVYGALNEEEKKWSAEAIAKMDGRPTAKKILELNLLEEHNNKFERQLKNEAALYQRFKVMVRGNAPKIKKGSPEYVFENSNYLAYIKDYGTSGFETEDEVKAFLEESKILGNVIIFKKLNVNIKYDISFN